MKIESSSPKVHPSSSYLIRTPLSTHAARCSAPNFHKMMYASSITMPTNDDQYPTDPHLPHSHSMAYDSIPAVPAIPNHLIHPQHSGRHSSNNSAILPGSYPSSVTSPDPIHPPPPSLTQNGYYHPSSHNGGAMIPKSGTIRKQVPLFQGNLVLECPVPTQLLDQSARKEKEFNQMRYTAVTCHPDEFPTRGYTLRPRLMNRQTELFIVMTMYNVGFFFTSWQTAESEIVA